MENGILVILTNTFNTRMKYVALYYIEIIIRLRNQKLT
jgi:hypothetical protein